MSKIFELDPSRMTYHKPQRSVAMCAVIGADHNSPDGIYYNVLPGVGETFGLPMVTAAGTGIAWIMEAVPGGPMDRWAQATGPDEMVALLKQHLEDFFPWEVARSADVTLADDNAWLCGAVSPLVRKPIATLSSGRKVVGMGDVVVLNDPCTGQGANTASAHAGVFHDMILEHQDRPFDDTWMQGTFDRFWAYAQWPTRFTHTMLAPLSDYDLQIIGAAAQLPEVAHRFAKAYDQPEDLAHYFFDPASAQNYLADASARAGFAEMGRSAVQVGAR
jgi:hypothetical protein